MSTSVQTRDRALLKLLTISLPRQSDRGETKNPPRSPSIESQNDPTSPHVPSSRSPETKRNRTGPSESRSGVETRSPNEPSADPSAVPSRVRSSRSTFILPGGSLV